MAKSTFNFYICRMLLTCPVGFLRYADMLLTCFLWAQQMWCYPSWKISLINVTSSVFECVWQWTPPHKESQSSAVAKVISSFADLASSIVANAQSGQDVHPYTQRSMDAGCSLRHGAWSPGGFLSGGLICDDQLDIGSDLANMNSLTLHQSTNL